MIRVPSAGFHPWSRQLLITLLALIALLKPTLVWRWGFGAFQYEIRTAGRLHQIPEHASIVPVRRSGQ